MAAASSSGDPKEHIEAIRRDFYLGGVTHRGNRNLLNSLEVAIQTVFASKQKFVLELLQNADDAKATHCSFQIVGSCLVVSHNGRPFSKEDVEKICNYGSAELDEGSEGVDARLARDKMRDGDTTGYKDVGFKSVFCITKRVVISSGGEFAGEQYPKYLFRFDESAWVGEAPASKKPQVPWQIIPIWTDSAELQGVQSALKDKVNFIFTLKEQDVDDIRKILNGALQGAELMLFLRNIREISFDDRSIKLVEVDTERKVKTIAVDGVPISFLWGSYPIQDESFLDVVRSLSALDAYQCPQKLRGVKQVWLTFLACLTDHTEAEVTPDAAATGALYTFLPTRVKTGLPVYANGDWLLNADRTAPLVNTWNIFLMGRLAELQIQWLSDLARQERWRDYVLRLLGPGYISNVAEELVGSYQKGLQKALREKTFIPRYFPTDAELLKLPDAMLDDTGFFRQFPELTPALYAEVAKVVRYELRDQDRLSKLSYDGDGQCHYTVARLIDDLDVIANKILTPELNRRLFIYLLGKIEYVSSLQKKAFVLAQDGSLHKPSELFFNNGGGAGASVLYEDLIYLHGEIVDGGGLYAWLRTLGVNNVDNIGMVRGRLLDMIGKGQVASQEISKQALLLLFTIYNADQYKVLQDVLSTLQGLPIQTRAHGLQPLNQCYFESDFWGKDETVPDGAQVIDFKFYVKPPKDKGQRQQLLKQWGDFLLWLGLKRELEFEILQNQSKNILRLNAAISRCYVYLGSLYNGGSNIIISALAYMPNMDSLLKNRSGRDWFWRSFVRQWHKIRTYGSVTYRNQRGDAAVSVESYLHYYCTRVSCFAARDKSEGGGEAGRLVASAALYWDGIEDVIGDVKTVSFVALPEGVSLTQEQAEFVGLRVRPSMGDLLDELTILSQKTRRVGGSVQSKFRRIVHFLTAQDWEKEDLEKITAWQQLPTSKLLAADGSWQLVTDLQVMFGADKVETSCLVAAVFENVGSAARLAKLLGKQVVQFGEDGLEITGKEKDHSHGSPQRIILEKLPILALLLAKVGVVDSLEEKQAVLKNLLQSFLRLDFCRCDTLTMFGAELLAYYCEGKREFYYTGRFGTSRTKAVFGEQLMLFLDPMRKLNYAEVYDLLSLNISRSDDLHAYFSGCELKVDDYERIGAYQRRIFAEVEEQVTRDREAAAVKVVVQEAAVAAAKVAVVGASATTRGDEEGSVVADPVAAVTAPTAVTRKDTIEDVRQGIAEVKVADAPPQPLPLIDAPFVELATRTQQPAAVAAVGGGGRAGGGRKTRGHGCRARGGVDESNTTEVGGRGEEYFYENELERSSLGRLLRLLTGLNLAINEAEYRKEDTELGFQFVRGDGEAKEVLLSVIWTSKQCWRASRKLADADHDFSIDCPLHQRRAILEVKTTTDRYNNRFLLSPNEFEIMKQERENYILIVMDLDKATGDVKMRGKKHNPFALYQCGELALTVNKLELSLRPNHQRLGEFWGAPGLNAEGSVADHRSGTRRRSSSFPK